MTKKRPWKMLLFTLPLLLSESSVVEAGTITSNFHLRGNTATAIFRTLDAQNPCVENFVSVVTSDLIEKVSPGGKTVTLGTALTIFQANTCTQTLLFDGFQEVATQTFRLAGDVSSATLSFTSPIFDDVLDQVVNVQVNLAFTANGKAQNLHSKDTFEDPELGIKILLKTRSMLAEATASGTVVVDGYNFTQQPTTNATIQKQNDGTLSITKTE